MRLQQSSVSVLGVVSSYSLPSPLTFRLFAHSSRIVLTYVTITFGHRAVLRLIVSHSGLISYCASSRSDGPHVLSGFSTATPITGVLYADSVLLDYRVSTSFSPFLTFYIVASHGTYLYNTGTVGACFSSLNVFKFCTGTVAGHLMR